MSQTFVDARDTLKVWDNLKNSVKERSAFTKENQTNSVDYGFITPHIVGDWNNKGLFRYCSSVEVNFRTLDPLLYVPASKGGSVVVIELLCAVDWCKDLSLLSKINEFIEKRQILSLQYSHQSWMPYSTIFLCTIHPLYQLVKWVMHRWMSS